MWARVVLVVSAGCGSSSAVGDGQSGANCADLRGEISGTVDGVQFGTLTSTMHMTITCPEYPNGRDFTTIRDATLVLTAEVPHGGTSAAYTLNQYAPTTMPIANGTGTLAEGMHDTCAAWLVHADFAAAGVLDGWIQR